MIDIAAHFRSIGISSFLAALLLSAHLGPPQPHFVLMVINFHVIATIVFSVNKFPSRPLHMVGTIYSCVLLPHIVPNHALSPTNFHCILKGTCQPLDYSTRNWSLSTIPIVSTTFRGIQLKTYLLYKKMTLDPIDTASKKKNTGPLWHTVWYRRNRSIVTDNEQIKDSIFVVWSSEKRSIIESVFYAIRNPSHSSSSLNSIDPKPNVREP